MSDSAEEHIKHISDLHEWPNQCSIHRRHWDALVRLARLGAKVEALCKKHGEKEKIRCSIGIMNLVFPSPYPMALDEER